MVTTKKFVRVPLYVDAAQVSETIMEELAEWAGGEIMETDERNRGVEKFIYIDVHSPMNERQKMAFAGDWVLSTDKGFKVYTNEAFKRMFEPFQDLETMETVHHNKVVFKAEPFGGYTNLNVDGSPQALSPEDFDANYEALKEEAAGKKARDRGVEQIQRNLNAKKSGVGTVEGDES